MLPKKRKQKESPDDDAEDCVVVTDVKVRYNYKNGGVDYFFNLSACCCGRNTIQATGTYTKFWKLDDPAIEMMNKSVTAIQNHNAKNIETCCLDLTPFALFMSKEFVSRGL